MKNDRFLCLVIVYQKSGVERCRKQDFQWRNLTPIGMQAQCLNCKV